MAFLATGCATRDQAEITQPLPSLPLPRLLSKPASAITDGQTGIVTRNREFLGENEVYKNIALAISRHGTLSSEYLLRGTQYERAAFLQTYLPQITPGASVDENGNTIARLRVEQIIWDGGRFRAGKHGLKASEAATFIEHAIHFNGRVGRAVEAYIDYHKGRALSVLSGDIFDRYGHLQRQAGERLSGGVGRLAEQSLFALKRLEAKSDHARDNAAAEAALVKLEGMTGERFDTPPRAFSFSQDARTIPLRVALSRAEQDKSAADLKAEKAQRLPRLSLRASTGVGSSFGLGFDDQANTASLGFELTKPLSWGQDYGVRAAYARLNAARAQMAEEIRDADVTLATVNQRIKELKAQLREGKELVQQAESRVHAFDQQFLAGVSTISEAAGIIDSFKRIKRAHIESEYALLAAQSEKAQMLGLFGPVAVTDAQQPPGQ